MGALRSIFERPACIRDPPVSEIQYQNNSTIKIMKNAFFKITAYVSGIRLRIIATLLCLAASGLLTGCLALDFGGSGHERVVTQTTPTLGKRLIDLKQARDSGAISEQDYEEQKAKLLGK